MSHRLVAIFGPTCSGKTRLAEELALRYRGEIISADSRQIYKFMDFGTGKLPRRREVITHLQDIVLPSQDYSVAQWARSAHQALADIWRRGKLPLVVGGTGFYLDVLLGYRQLAGAPPQKELRERLEKKTREELFCQLVSLDRARAKTIDRHNKRRLVRAVEVALATPGKTGIALPALPANTSALLLGLTGDKAILYRRADRWAEELLQGERFLREVAFLVAQGWGETPPLQGIIYAPTRQYLRGEISLPALKQIIKSELHRYIKRQLTWFKKSPSNATWLDIAQPTTRQEADELVKFSLKNG